MCFEIACLLKVSKTFDKWAEKWLLRTSSSLWFHIRISYLDSLALEIADHLFARREGLAAAHLAIGWRFLPINFLIQTQIWIVRWFIFNGNQMKVRRSILFQDLYFTYLLLVGNLFGTFRTRVYHIVDLALVQVLEIEDQVLLIERVGRPSFHIKIFW